MTYIKYVVESITRDCGWLDYTCNTERAETSFILNITFDCAGPRALARFWGQVTGWPVTEEPRPGFAEAAVGTPGEDRPRLYFVQVPEG